MSAEIADELREMIDHDASLGLKPPLHAQIRALLDALDAKDKRIAELEADNRRMRRREETSLKFWMRAAKAALAGDTRELRNRVDLIEAEPVSVVLSARPNKEDRNG